MDFNPTKKTTTPPTTPTSNKDKDEEDRCSSNSCTEFVEALFDVPRYENYTFVSIPLSPGNDTITTTRYRTANGTSANDDNNNDRAMLNETKTELQITMDVDEKYEHHMNDLWTQALQLLKTICEEKDQNSK